MSINTFPFLHIIFSNELVATDFSVGVGGTDPNELFVNVPDDAAINAALDHAGFPSCNCSPVVCTSKNLDGVVEDTPAQRIELEADLTQAYILANPSITAAAINVNITTMESKQTEDG